MVRSSAASELFAILLACVPLAAAWGISAGLHELGVGDGPPTFLGNEAVTSGSGPRTLEFVSAGELRAASLTTPSAPALDPVELRRSDVRVVDAGVAEVEALPASARELASGVDVLFLGLGLVDASDADASHEATLRAEVARSALAEVAALCASRDVALVVWTTGEPAGALWRPSPAARGVDSTPHLERAVIAAAVEFGFTHVAAAEAGPEAALEALFAGERAR